MKTLILAALLFQAAPSEPSDDGWRQSRVRVTVGDSEAALLHVAYTPRTDVPGTAFYCGEGKLRVRFATEAVDLRDTLGRLWTPTRYRTLRLTIDGEATEAARWSYLPRVKLLVAGERKASAQAFNAVVRGQTIAFDASGERVEPHTPPVDAAFKAWVAACKADGHL